MPLYVKDREVGELADKLAALMNTNKTEAVRSALRHEISQVSRPASHSRNAQRDEYIERALHLARELRRQLPPGEKPMPVTKEWLDSLCENG